MNKIRKWINNTKLRYKLLLFYSGFCLLPVAVLFAFSFIQMNTIINDKEEVNLKSYLYQSVSTMDRSLDAYSTLADYLLVDQGLTKALEKEYETPYEQYVQMTEVIDPLLQSTKYFHTDVKRVTIYTDNGMVKHDTTIAPLSEISEQSWYPMALLSNDLVWYVDPEKREMLAVRVMPVETKTGKPCILCVEINYDKLFAPYEQTLTSEYGVYITDKTGQVLYSSSHFSEEEKEHALTFQRFMEEKAKEEHSDYVIISQESLSLGEWTVWLYQPKSITNDAMLPIFYMIVLTAALCLIGLALAYYAIKQLSGRIEKLTSNMLEVENGNMDVQVTSNAQDEIGHLYRGLGKMLDQIRTLIQEVYVSKIVQKELEMKALQSQINPHFLYNTLSVINWKAIAAGEKDISKMTLAMSTFYRTALNRGKNTLRVSDELKNTKAYLEIMSMMHDDDFDYELIVEPEIMGYESLNLILQPLVENAIKHGIERKTDGERGRIEIRGWLENECIWFEVADNGNGMDKETARRILTEESKGYGARNVSERLQIFYGEEYKLKIESNPGQGTKMILHFPIKNNINREMKVRRIF